MMTSTVVTFVRLITVMFLVGFTKTMSSAQLVASRASSTTSLPTADRNKEVIDDKYRPRNVIASVINSTTIRLQWDHARSVIESTDASGINRCPIARYTVRLKTDGHGTGRRRSVAASASQAQSRTWKIDGGRRSITLYDLTPSMSYFVRVLAIGCDGTRSKPSPWIGVHTGPGMVDVTASGPSANSFTKPIPVERAPVVATAVGGATKREERDDRSEVDYDDDDDGDRTVSDEQEASTPGKPTYVRTRTFSDSVMVSWLPPDDGSVVRGYMIGYGEGVPDVNWQYVDASKTNVTIKNLKPATQYIVSLRAFNNHGKGQVIYDLIYTRDAAGPAVASPIDLRTKILSPTTIWLQWTDPSLGRTQQATDNRYYNVHYKQLPSVGGTPVESGAAGGGKTLSMIVKDQHVVFYDLHPGTRYEFKVRSVKDAVASAFSDPVINKTFETAPSSPPRNIVVMPTNISGTLRVTWKAPRLINGDITGYLVLYTLNSEQPADQWQTKTVTGPETETLISNLKADTTYHFRVQARNSVGYSPTSSNSLFYLKPYPTVPQQSQQKLMSSSDTTLGESTRPSQMTSEPSGSTNSTELHGIIDDDGDDPDNDERSRNLDAADAQASTDLRQSSADIDDDVSTPAPLVLDGITPAAMVQAQPDHFMSTPNADLYSSPDASVNGDDEIGPSNSKTKREPAEMHRATDHKVNNTLTDQRSQDSVASSRRQSVENTSGSNRAISATGQTNGLPGFKVIVRHRISAYITWPEPQKRQPCSDTRNVLVTRRPPVIGYKLRYYYGEATTTGSEPNNAAMVLNLTTNVALLDDLRPNTEYWYQISTVYADGTESGWSQQNMIDTR